MTIDGKLEEFSFVKSFFSVQYLEEFKYINLLPNSVLEDLFHHFHTRSNNLIPL